MPFSLTLFGGATLASEDGPLSGPATHRHRLALLALLSSSHPLPVSRDKLMAWLWPERDRDHSRQLLNQSIHELRRALGADAILSFGDDLRLNPAVLRCDVMAFDDAFAAGRAEDAVALYRGPFLDGFFLDEAPELERWIDLQRERYAAAKGKALEELAGRAEREERMGAAVEWWVALATHDPLNSRIAVRLMEALERAGNRAGAIKQGLAHCQRVRDALEIEPSAEVLDKLEGLRRAPPAAMPANIETRRSRAVHPVATALDVAAAAVSSSRTSAVSEAPRARSRGRWPFFAAIAAAIGAVLVGALRLPSRGPQPGTAPGPLARTDARSRSIPAYDLYLRGSDPALLRSDSGARAGVTYLRRAIALDSGYPDAWARLASLMLRVAEDERIEAAAETRRQAETAARRAIALDDSSADGHAILGLVHTASWDFRRAQHEFQRAITLEPGRARIREWAVTLHLAADRRDEALAEAERAAALEPLSPSAAAELARALLAKGRCGEALKRLERILSLDPPLLRAAPIAAQCYMRKGRWSEAIALLRPEATRGQQLSLALLGYALARSGQRGEARSIQEALLARWRDGGISAYYLALVPVGLGERDEAFAWLDRSLEEAAAGIYPGLRAGLAQPVLDDLSQDARWPALRRRTDAVAARSE